jgi:hypothetical protein
MTAEEFYKSWIASHQELLGSAVTWPASATIFEFADEFAEAREKELREALRKIIDEATLGKFCDLCGGFSDTHDKYCVILAAEKLLAGEPEK